MKLKNFDLNVVKQHPRVSLAVVVAFFLIVAFVADYKPEKKSPLAPTPHEEDSVIDTYIPDGFVLVPIDVQNLASLDAMVGQFGVVDLYTENQDLAVATGLRIIRSPKDPSQFGVLVPQMRSRDIVKKNARPYIVVVQNPKQKHTQFKKEIAPSTQIVWEN